MYRNCLILCCLLLLASTANAQTEILSNKYFDIYYPASRSEIAEVVGSYGITELERISRNLKQRTVKRITISILEETEYRQQYSDYLPEWGVAFAIPEKNLILLIFPESFSNPSRLRFIIGHEIAHLLVHDRVATFIPRWFDEGMAMYLSREPNLIDEMQLLLAVLIGGIVPLQRIERSFPETGRSARLAYIESASAILFLIEECGPSSIIQILDATREAGDFRTGFIAATGFDLPQFEMEWRRWIRKRFTLAVLLQPNLLFAVAALSVLMLGIVAKLRRKSASGIDERIEE
jgi:hypothetical protein